jgi:hypothetical protein
VAREQGLAADRRATASAAGGERVARWGGFRGDLGRVLPGEGARVPREGAPAGPGCRGAAHPALWWARHRCAASCQRECFDLGDFDRVFLPKLELKCIKE